MDEFTLIERYFKRQCRSANLALGVGDDCAVLDVPAGYELVFSIDSLLQDVHFFAASDPSLIGQRALRVALSDLAAMGAKPLCFTMALSLPEANDRWLKGFSAGLFDAAERYHCELAGGDTIKGPLLISIQVHGTVPKGQAIRRAGARPGDRVCVTGCLGDGAAALRALRGELVLEDAALEYFRERYYCPQPRIAAGRWIRSVASAAIDISDGLLADLGHICRASGVGARLDVSAVPLSEALRAAVDEAQQVQWALAGGDDYQLCFTVPQSRSDALFQLVKRYELDVSVIGKVVAEAGIYCDETGALLSASVGGYRHFD